MKGIIRDAALLVCLVTLASCQRVPLLHLHRDATVSIAFPLVDLDLGTVWDYETPFDWEAEWLYGWDDMDQTSFGELGYTVPEAFNIRRFYYGYSNDYPAPRCQSDYVRGSNFTASYDFGYYDIVVWNEIRTPDNVQAVHIDENQENGIHAYTGSSMSHVASYPGTKGGLSFHQPESLFSGFGDDIFISDRLEDYDWFDEDTNTWYKRLSLTLSPVTNIYLTQILLRHNEGRVTGVDGLANMSGLAPGMILESGERDKDAVSVNYGVRLKAGCKDYDGSAVDIVGGRIMTFGLPSGFSERNYLDVGLRFYNGTDSTFVFDVSDQLRKRYKGGVITIVLDVDKVEIPKRSGGSAFEAVVVDREDGGTYEFEM